MNQRLEIAAKILAAWHSDVTDVDPKMEYAPAWALKWADALIAQHEATTNEYVTVGVETENIRVMITADAYRLIRRIKNVDQATKILEANGYLREG